MGQGKIVGQIQKNLKMENSYFLRPAKPVPSELEKCLAEITDGKLSYREAQEKYHFSKSTLHRYRLNGRTSPVTAGAKRKLTDLEFESIAEKCRENYIVNQQTTLLMLKQYVAEVTAARGVKWLIAFRQMTT